MLILYKMFFSVISSDPQVIQRHFRFTTIPFNPCLSIEYVKLSPLDRSIFPLETMKEMFKI